MASIALGACHSGEEWSNEMPMPDGMPIAVHTRVEAEELLNSGPSGRLLFWNNNVFKDDWVAGKPNAKPTFTVLLDKEINHYAFDRHVYFETPYTYPSNTGIIYATGYAPDNQLTPSQNKDYTELDVKTTDGSIDLLTCDGCDKHSASMREGNTFLQKSKELNFRHLTAKLTFLGVRDKEMIGMVGVRNINIKFIEPKEDADKLFVPTKLKQYVQKESNYTTYIVSKTTPYSYANKKLEHKPIIPPNETVTLGTCYVLSGGITYGKEEGNFDPVKGEWVGTPPTDMPKLGIIVTAELYDAKAGSDPSAFTTETWKLDPILKWEKHTGNKFLPGYEYKVIITFNRTGVALRAETVPWNSEELHEYPIHPIKQ